MKLGHPAKGGEGAKVRYGLRWHPKKKKVEDDKHKKHKKHGR
jgi:hypothetical protein